MMIISSIRLLAVILALMAAVFLFISKAMNGYWAGVLFGLFLATMFEFTVFTTAAFRLWYMARKTK